MATDNKLRLSGVGLVVTTIADGRFLNSLEPALVHPAGEPVTLYVVGDLKTPDSCRQHAQQLSDRGIDCRFLDPDTQREFLGPFSALQNRIPWRSDNRRNVGFLMALRDGCRVIIALDDDAIPVSPATFLPEYLHTTNRRQLPVLKSENGWINCCRLLDLASYSGQSVEVYPRGFPARRCGGDHTSADEREESGVIGVHAGLWIGDPDVDATARLAMGCVADSQLDHSYLLSAGQRTLISSMNCAVGWHAMPAYYYPRMGHSVSGLAIDRYADVLSGYFVQMCAEAVGQRTSIGLPLVRHDRTIHNLFKDLAHELPGMVMVDEMLPLFEQPLTRARSYDVAYLELADRVERYPFRRDVFLWNDTLSAWAADLAQSMRIWVDVCRTLAGDRPLAIS